MGKIEDSLEELTKEIDRLRLLKARGKFNLQQSEYSLKRLTEKLVNLWNKK